MKNFFIDLFSSLIHDRDRLACIVLIWQSNGTLSQNLKIKETCEYVSKRQLFCQFQPTVNNFQRQTLPQKGDFPTSKLLKCRPMIWIQKGHINILCLLLIEVECISLQTTQFLLLLLLQMSLCCSFESMSKLSGVCIGKEN